MNNDDGEIAQVTHFMKGVARVMERQSLPDAHEVWIRIQLEERQRLAQRARLPVKLAWMFAKCWFACGSALIVYLFGPATGDLFVAIPTYVYVAIATVVVIVLRGRRLLRG
jgi:hypothetical protein